MTSPYGLPPPLALVLTAMAVMGSPGPSTISLVAASVAYGVRRSTGYCLGLVLGAILVLLAAATGVTAVLLAVPALHWVLLAAATSYLLWLAFRLATAPPPDARPAGARHPGLADGLLLGVLNPKAWIAITAVFAGARLADGALADAALKVPLLAAVVVAIHAGWLFAGRLLAPAMRRPGPARAINITLAVLLVAAALLALLPGAR
jgi:threonine/homoserine/homoserine lactone efflux protein